MSLFGDGNRANNKTSIAEECNTQGNGSKIVTTEELAKQALPEFGGISWEDMGEAAHATSYLTERYFPGPTL